MTASHRRRWRCQTCDQILPSWAAAERHADTHGGARLDVLLDGALDFDDDHQRVDEIRPPARFL